MIRSTLQFMLAAASLATAVSASAAPVAVNFKATINYHDNYQNQLSQYVGQQVTGTFWLNSDLGAPTNQYSSGYGSYKQWYGQHGCNVASQGNCSNTVNYGTPLVVLGYQLALPSGSVQQGSLIQSPLRMESNGISKQVWGDWEYLSYWQQSWIQDGLWGDAHYTVESQSLSLSLQGSDVFADMANPVELLANLSGANGKYLYFSHSKQICDNSIYGYNCNIYAPESMNLNMTLNELTIQGVPEPASIGLLGLGLAGLALMRRRQR